MDHNFSRLLDTLAAIPAHPTKLTTEKILERLQTQGHSVTLRTVQRDLHNLSEHYPDIVKLKHKPIQWGWRQDAPVLFLAQMGLPQALAFDLFAREFGHTLPNELQALLTPWLQEARRTLENAPRQQVSQWANKIAVLPDGPPLLAPKILPATMSQVTQALFEGKTIQANYRKAYTSTANVYELHPLGLIRRGQTSYLVTTFDGHHEPCTLALHRMDKVLVLDKPVHRSSTPNDISA